MGDPVIFADLKELIAALINDKFALNKLQKEELFNARHIKWATNYVKCTVELRNSEKPPH